MSVTFDTVSLALNVYAEEAEIPLVKNDVPSSNDNKGGIGTYHYGSDRPHAVTDITGIEDMAAVTPQQTTFNDDGKIKHMARKVGGDHNIIWVMALY